MINHIQNQEMSDIEKQIYDHERVETAKFSHQNNGILELHSMYFKSLDHLYLEDLKERCDNSQAYEIVSENPFTANKETLKLFLESKIDLFKELFDCKSFHFVGEPEISPSYIFEIIVIINGIKLKTVGNILSNTQEFYGIYYKPNFKICRP